MGLGHFRYSYGVMTLFLQLCCCSHQYSYAVIVNCGGYELTDVFTAGGVCRVPALGNIQIYEGEHASKLLIGGSECEVYTCQVCTFMYTISCTYTVCIYSAKYSP